MFNNPKLIIKLSNNFPFNLDTRLTINTQYPYTINNIDYQQLVNLIKDIIAANYNIDNSLNM